MTLKEKVRLIMQKGHTEKSAQSLVAQEIIIEAISASPYLDRVLFKGGVVMYNISKNERRASRDIDFDMIRYDISNNDNIDAFINIINKKSVGVSIKRKGDIFDLHQEDYKGKRVTLLIEDQSYSMSIKIDIGVHTLFLVAQPYMVFDLCSSGKSLKVRVNPVEQIIAEKLYSLAKHRILSTRFKDIYDIYYLITNYKINNEDTKILLNTLIKYGNNDIGDIETLIERIIDTFNNKTFTDRLKNADYDWIDNCSDDKVLNTIVNFIYTI